MKNRHTKGFTLIELLVVISIIAVLSSIVLAALSTARGKAVTAAGQTFEGQMYQAYGANAVAIWNFDDGAGSLTAADTSGNHNNLTVHSNTPSFMQTGTVFRGLSALSIPIGTSAINPAYINSMPSGFDPTNGSVSFWIDLYQGASEQGVFCSMNYAQFCIFSSANTDSNFIQVVWKGGSTLSTSISPDSVIGKWTQVAVSWSGSTINIFVNGNQVASSSSYSPPTTASLSTGFCVGGDGHGQDMYGVLDEMRVYKQSLQTGEVEKLYAEELPKHLLADADAGSK